MTQPISPLPGNNQPSQQRLKESLKESLKDRVILVTGSSQPHSLGRAAAMVYAEHGATVILHGRDMPKLEAAYDEIEVKGYPQPAIMALDYRGATQADLDGFAETIRATFGRLDGIFHGVSHFSPLMPMALQSLDVWQKHLTVNLAVPVALTKACIPLLTSKSVGQAAVVFLSETHAVAPTAYWGPFATSKASLSTVVDIWNAEMIDSSQVKFQIFVPGPVASPMRHKSHPGEQTATLPAPATLASRFLHCMGA